MGKARWGSVLGALVVLVAAGTAWAGEAAGKAKGETSEPVKGPGEERTLTGKIVGIEEKVLYVEHMGAIFQLQVNPETKLKGEATRKSQRVQQRLKDEFREGDEVRATFEIESQKRRAAKHNVAIAIDPATVPQKK